MYYFSADEHYGHAEMLQYRPLKSVEEMDQALIDNHNEVVQEGDTTVHVGDFTMAKDPAFAQGIIEQLTGNHIFIKGSHDYWLDRDPVCSPADYMWEKTFKYPAMKRYFISACHYPMRSWPRSHYPNSWQLFGHHHGQVPAYGLQMDVGVDTNKLSPYSFDQIIEILEPREALFQKALPLFDDDDEKTWDWLCKPQKGLNGQIPINQIRTPVGFESVKSLLAL